MVAKNLTGDGFLQKQKKSVSRFKNNKRRFNESAEMQDDRARRISLKSYLQELKELEAEESMDELDENEGI